MKDDIRTKFEKLLAVDRKEQADIAKAVQDRIDTTKASEAAWSQCIATELEPTMLPIASMLTEGGWICSVKTEEQKFVVSMHRGAMASAGGAGRPHLDFASDKNSKITISQVTQSRVTTDQQIYPLEEITPDFFQNRVLQFFETLVSGR